MWRERFYRKDFFQETLNRVWSDQENWDMQVGRDGTPGGEMCNEDDDGTNKVRDG